MFDLLSLIGNTKENNSVATRVLNGRQLHLLIGN